MIRLPDGVMLIEDRERGRRRRYRRLLVGLLLAGPWRGGRVDLEEVQRGLQCLILARSHVDLHDKRRPFWALDAENRSYVRNVRVNSASSQLRRK
jgi:hypothetical protein